VVDLPDAYRVCNLSVTLFFAVWIIRVLLRELGGEPELCAQGCAGDCRWRLNYRIEAREGDSFSLIAAMRSMQGTLGIHGARGATRVGRGACACARRWTMRRPT